jgi:hypothetical protein
MDHSITPPPDKHKQWEDDILFERENVDVTLDCAWRDGFRAGADQELEACIEWLWRNHYDMAPVALRAARRPKPPSLKEQALEEVGVFEGMGTCDIDIIRRALEQLDD